MPSPFASQEFINALVTFLVALSVALQAWAHGKSKDISKVQTEQGKQINTIEQHTNGIVAGLSQQVESAHASALADKDRQIAVLSMAATKKLNGE